MGHTPGPWGWKTTPGSDHEFCTVYAKDGKGKAVARHVLPEDARAIVALPDLLELCKELVADAEKASSPSSRQYKYRELKELIAKVTGEPNAPTGGE